MRYRFTRMSKNKKTGPIPVTTTEESSCPSACPLKDNGCYADGGPLALVWRQTATMGKTLQALCEDIKALPSGQLWRHNQAGDLPHKDQVIDAAGVRALTKASRGTRGFTYTHHDMSMAKNRRVVSEANKAGFVINLSANTLKHADKLAKYGIAPVAVMLPSDSPAKLLTPAGRTVVVCPVMTGKAQSCATCKLCAVRDRKVIVGFPAHGFRTRKASAVASA